MGWGSSEKGKGVIRHVLTIDRVEIGIRLTVSLSL